MIKATHLLKCFLGPTSYSEIGQESISLSLGSFTHTTVSSHLDEGARSLQVIPDLLLQKYLGAALQTQVPLSHSTYGIAVVEVQQLLPPRLC